MNNVDNQIPSILQKVPAPRLEPRFFAKKQLSVWTGKAKVADILGWVDNPRLNLELEKFRAANAEATPTQDDILAIMRSVSEFELDTLVADIRENGIRTPLILNHEGVLLDGNRRFFAVKQLLNGISADDPNIDRYSTAPVIVLSDECTQDDEDLVLWHENFYPALKKEWPDYVRATYIIEALKAGESEADVARRFGWSKAKVRETSRIMELIGDYIDFAVAPAPDGLGMNELEAKAEANASYQYFNEAQKSLWTQLASDIDFKWQFFKWLNEKKFKSFQEVRVAWKAWSDDALRKILLSSDPEASKKVVAEINYRNVNQSQQKIAADEFRKFQEFLKNMKASDVASLNDDDIETLNGIVDVLSKMARAAKSESN